MIKELELFIQKNNQPIYLQVAKAIRNAILNEQLKNGEILPSSRMLSAKLKIGRLTVMNALEELHAEGLIESKLRKHYFVTFEPELNKNIMRNNDETITVYEIKNQNETLSSQKSHLKYDMRSGVPELDLIPRKEIKKIYSHLIDNDHKDLFDYTTKTQGDLSFLNEISNYFRRKRFLLNKHYMTTNGSQEAIYLIAHHLLKKGDYVAMEEKTYQSAFDIFKKMNIKIIPIQTSPLSGINIKHFQKMIEQYPIKLIYLTPSHQYPTTFSMTYPQKIQIYQSCLSKKIKIIEDDYDFEFSYHNQPIPPIASLDQNGLVYYLASLSKILFPSLRLGVLSAPMNHIGPLIGNKKLMNTQSSTIDQRMVAELIRSGGFEKHIRKMKKIYFQRKIMLEMEIKKNPIFKIFPSHGGMSLYIETSVPSKSLLNQASLKGVLFTPSFNIKNNSMERGFRLNFANLDEKKFKEGIKIISESYHEIKNQYRE